MNTTFHAFAATNMFRVIHSNPNHLVPPKGHKDFNSQYSDERNKSKNGTFKAAFGGSGYTMAMDLGVSLEEGEAFMQSWFDGFPGLEKNFSKTKKLAVQRGWVRLDKFTNKRYWFGKFKEMNSYKDRIYELVPNYNELSKTQRSQLPEYEEIRQCWRNYFYLHSKLERKSLNYRIQGAAAMMMKMALLYIHRWRWDNGYEKSCYVTIPVHDEANAECLDKQLEDKFQNIIENSMVKAGTFICTSIPMGVDTEKGDHWIH